MAVGFVISSLQIGQHLLSSGNGTTFTPLGKASIPFSARGVGPCFGGGSSIAAFVFAESWRAKSEAYHHSRNLRKKIDVGRSSLSESRSFGRSTLDRKTGLRSFVRVILGGGRPGWWDWKLEAASCARWFFC